MKILLATHGSGPAKEGERLVKSMFRPGLRIHVLTVTPEPGYGPVLSDEDFELKRLDVPILTGAEVAKEAADRLSNRGFEVSSSEAHGLPGVEILRALEDPDFDLVVLGASHTTWMGNILMGSVSTRVLHHAPCSVLVSRSSPKDTRKVLVGADGSDASMASLRLAATVLDPSRCSVEVATVVTHPWAASAVHPTGPFPVAIPDYQALDKERIDAGRLISDKAKRYLERAGFDVDSTVLVGRPLHQLLKEGDNLGSDLAIVGSRGMGPIGRTFLGSVSDQMVRHMPATLVGRTR